MTVSIDDDIQENTTIMVTLQCCAVIRSFDKVQYDTIKLVQLKKFMFFKAYNP